MVTEGIYSKIRHPLYLGLVLIYPGFALSWGCVWILIPAVIFVILIMLTAIREEKIMKEKFRKEYEEYMRRAMEIYTKGILKGLRATLHSLTLASMLSHSDNRRIRGFTNAHSNLPSQTLHILTPSYQQANRKPLSQIRILNIPFFLTTQLVDLYISKQHQLCYLGTAMERL